VSGILQTLLQTQDTVVGAAVDYVPDSKDTQTGSGDFLLNNANVDPDGEGFPNAVLVVSISMEWTSGDAFTGEFGCVVDQSLDPHPMQIRSIANSAAKRFQQLAMVRIPPNGFFLGFVNFSPSEALPASNTIRISANVMYNVNDTSIGFDDGFVALDNVVDTSAVPLDVPTNGAIFLTNMQNNGGDVDALVESVVDSVVYTMQFPDLFVSIRRYMTGYKLFPVARNDEAVRSPPAFELNLQPVIAVVLRPA